MATAKAREAAFGAALPGPPPPPSPAGARPPATAQSPPGAGAGAWPPRHGGAAAAQAAPGRAAPGEAPSSMTPQGCLASQSSRMASESFRFSRWARSLGEQPITSS